MELKTRIAAVLGWSQADTDSLSLLSLREIVKPVSPKLAAEITEAVRSGSCIVRRGAK